MPLVRRKMEHCLRRLFSSGSSSTRDSVSKLSSELASGRFYASVRLAISILVSSPRPTSQIVDLYRSISASPHSTQSFLCDAASALIIASTRIRLPDGAMRLLSVIASDVYLPMPSLSSCLVLMDHLFSIGRHADILKTFDLLVGAGVSIDTAIFSKTLSACIAAGDVDHAVHMLLNYRSPDISCYHIVLRALCSVGRVPDARNLFNQIPDDTVSVTTYNILIAGYCKSGRIEDAIDLRCDMLTEGLVPDIVTYSSLLMACLSCGMMAEVGALLGEMLTAEVALRGFPRSLIFEILGKIEVKDALHLIDRTIEKGYLIDSRACSVIISLLCNSGEVIAAQNLFRRLLKAGLQPTKIMYNKLMDGEIQVGNLDGAISLFTEMRSSCVGYDTVSLNTLVKGYCSKGLLKEAQELITNMEKSNLKPSIVAFNTILNSLGRSGQVQDCVDFFNNIMKNGLQANAVSYSILMNVLCKTGRLSDALCLLSKMVQNNIRPDAQVFHILMDSCIEFGRIETASCLQQAMRNYGITETIVTINLLVKLKCKQGDIQGAEHLVLGLKLPPLLPDMITYSTIITACCKFNRVDSAVLFYQNMINQTIRPPRSIYQLLYTSLMSNGRATDADNIYKEMVYTNIIRSSRRGISE